MLDNIQLANTHRPEWNSIWMEFAHIIARRSYDTRHQVGAVVVSDDNTQVLAIGYNGKFNYDLTKPVGIFVTLSPCDIHICE